MARIDANRGDHLADQDTPVIQVIGRITGTGAEDAGGTSTGTKFLVHVGWSRKTYQLSVRGLKVLKGLDVNVLDEPSEYTF